MSKRRTITFTLTEAQYDALCSAVALCAVHLEDDVMDGLATTTDQKVLERAWSALKAAWYK